MKPNKVKIGYKKPSGAQIDRYKDFGVVLQNYQKLTRPFYRKPLYKDPKSFLGLVLLLTIGLLIYIAVKEEELARKSGETVVVPKYQEEEIAKESWQLDSFFISPKERVEIELLNGKKLEFRTGGQQQAFIGEMKDWKTMVPALSLANSNRYLTANAIRLRFKEGKSLEKPTKLILPVKEPHYGTLEQVFYRKDEHYPWEPVPPSEIKSELVREKGAFDGLTLIEEGGYVSSKAASAEIKSRYILLSKQGDWLLAYTAKLPTVASKLLFRLYYEEKPVKAETIFFVDESGEVLWAPTIKNKKNEMEVDCPSAMLKGHVLVFHSEIGWLLGAIPFGKGTTPRKIEMTLLYNSTSKLSRLAE